MGASDWQELAGPILSTADLAHGATPTISPPPGATNVYGYNSLDGSTSSAHGYFLVGTEFDPMDRGGVLEGCIKRRASSGIDRFSPFFFMGAQSGPADVTDSAYLIGLCDGDPYRIAVGKGMIAGGLPEADAESTVVLAVSDEQYRIVDDIWHQLRIEKYDQPNGDVLIKVWESDLSVYDCDSPSWNLVAGLYDPTAAAEYQGVIDDALHERSGSAPLIGGRMGFAFAVQEGIGRRGGFAWIRGARHT